MIDAQTQSDLFCTPVAGQRRIFVRATVGALVLCAALGGPAVQAQAALQQGQAIFASPSFAVKSTQRGRALANSYDHLFKTTCTNGPSRDVGLVVSNMTASANGKQLAMNLEMSRERAGNLLRQHLSLP